MDTREEGQTSVRPSSNLLKPDERLAPVGYFNLARYGGYQVPVTGWYLVQGLNQV